MNIVAVGLDLTGMLLGCGSEGPETVNNRDSDETDEN